MMTALIEVNPTTNQDPQGWVEVKLPIEKIQEAAKEVRSIKYDGDPVSYISKVSSVKGFVKGQVTVKACAYILNGKVAKEEEDGGCVVVKGTNAKQARPKGK